MIWWTDKLREWCEKYNVHTVPFDADPNYENAIKQCEKDLIEKKYK